VAAVDRLAGRATVPGNVDPGSRVFLDAGNERYQAMHPKETEEARRQFAKWRGMVQGAVKGWK
jgi:hypothetical protein